MYKDYNNQYTYIHPLKNNHNLDNMGYAQDIYVLFCRCCCCTRVLCADVTDNIPGKGRINVTTTQTDLKPSGLSQP